MKNNSMAAVWFAARLFLGLVFAYAGYAKLMEPVENFRGILTQYQIIPYGLAPFIARTFPWIEFIAGVFLTLGYAPRLSALILGVMSLGFAIVLSLSHLIYGSTPASCGCFGVSGFHLTTPQVFILDLLDTAIGFKLFLMKDFPWSLDAWLKKR